MNRDFQVVTKAIGAICNLDCKYCFYLEKEALFSSAQSFRMTEEQLETYIQQHIESQDIPEIHFVWQGGEPTLLGVDFFRKAVALQEKYADGKRIHNAFQTNGLLLDDAWCSFFTEHGFLIGLSLDGPAELHDAYRVDKQGRPSFDLVMQGLSFLRKHQSEFNTLTVVNRQNAQHPLRVYRFLKEIGSNHLQFIPLVERLPSRAAKERGCNLNGPPGAFDSNPDTPVTAWSTDAEDYGTFLIEIFDEWVRRDVGSTFIRFFDVALGHWMGAGSSLCVFAETCGRALALEHNGDLYACDHYVYPRYKRGNIRDTPLQELVESKAQVQFGLNKRDTLPGYCRSCEVRFACNGGCPKNRFIKTPDGEPGLNYLCAAYKRIFRHMDPAMREMAALLRTGRPAALVMEYMQRMDCQCGLTSKSASTPFNLEP